MVTIKGHSGTVRSLEYIPDFHLLVTVTDTTVNIWNTINANNLKMLKFATEIVSVKYVKEKHVLFLATELSVKIIDMNTYLTIQNLVDFKCKICSFDIKNELLVIGSKSDIKIFNYLTNECMATLKGIVVPTNYPKLNDFRLIDIHIIFFVLSFFLLFW